MRITNGYYVKRLEENPVNRFKWIYIDSYDGDLREDDNKWYFDLKFYIIQNLYLPLNTFSVSLSTQFCEISDLSINPTSISQVPNWVIQGNYCTPYSLTFNIDLNDSKFFQELLNNYKIDLTFKLSIDTTILNNSKVELDQDEYNQFVTECYEQEIQSNFRYSNFEEKTINENTFNMPSSYYLNSSIGSYTNNEIVYYSLDPIEQVDDPIKKLVEISFPSEYTIFIQKIKFVYQVLGSKQQELNYESSTPYYGNTPITLNYGFCTYFNESSSTIENQTNGINGFYCPKACVGYYDVQIKVNFNNTTKTIKFTNNFSFKGNDEFAMKKIQVSQCFINNLDYFNEVNF